jgi:hypothetical protein
VLDDHARARRDPAAGRQARQRRLRRSLAIGRIEKDKVEWRCEPGRAHAQFGRVATVHAGDAEHAERFDVGADGAAGGLVGLDEQRKDRAPRQRFEPQRAGAGEEIKHARAHDAG